MSPNCLQPFMSANCSTDSQPNSTISINSAGIVGSTPSGVDNNNSTVSNAHEILMNSELIKPDEESVMNFLNPQIRSGFSSPFSGTLKEQQYNPAHDSPSYSMRRMGYSQLTLPQISTRFEGLGPHAHQQADSRMFLSHELAGPYAAQHMVSSSSAFHPAASYLQSFRTQYQPNNYASSTNIVRPSPGSCHLNTLSPTDTSGGGFLDHHQNSKLFDDVDAQRQVVTDASMVRTGRIFTSSFIFQFKNKQVCRRNLFFIYKSQTEWGVKLWDKVSLRH